MCWLLDNYFSRKEISSLCAGKILTFQIKSKKNWFQSERYVDFGIYFSVYCINCIFFFQYPLFPFSIPNCCTYKMYFRVYKFYLALQFICFLLLLVNISKLVKKSNHLSILFDEYSCKSIVARQKTIGNTLFKIFYNSFSA